MSNSAYSPIQHIADAIFINHIPDQRYFVVLTMDEAYTAYFDASGHPTDGVMLVTGGFIASVASWRVFEKEWNTVLAKYGVPYFHRKKFFARKSPFDAAKWQHAEVRTGFLAELRGAMKRSGCNGLVTLLPLTDWEVVNNEYCMQEEKLTPFSVTACMGIVGAYEWCKERAIPYEHVEFIFEDGDEDKGDLMHWTKKAWGWTPSFKSKALLPLQACDYLAGETRRGEIDATSPGVDPETFKLRKCLLRLMDQIPIDDRKWDVHALRGLCEKHNIKKR